MKKKSGYGIKKKIVISILSGISGFLFSQFGFDARVGEIAISIPWSLIFPIVTAIAFGSRYGIIAGLAGGAYFPFLLWPNNGIPNVTTALVYLVVYFLLGLLHDKNFWGKQKKDSVRIIAILTVCIAIFAFYYSLLFNPLLSFNPSLGLKNAIIGLPANVLSSFIIKESINLILLTFVALTLLELAWVRKALGMQFVPANKSNNTILVYVILVFATIWLLLVGLGYSLLHGDYVFKSQQLSLVLFVILVAGFVVARVLFQYNKNKLNIENKLKLAKEKAEESEEKYRLLHENAGIGIGYYSPEGIVISFNSVAAKNIQRVPGDFIGKSIFSLFSKEEADFYFERMKNAILSEEPTVYEDLVHLLNEDKWFLNTFTKIVNSENNILGIQIISQDITEIKNSKIELLKAIEKAEESEGALKQSELQNRTILQTALDGFWIVDINGRFTEVNKAYCQLIGYSRDELLTMSISDLEVVDSEADVHQRIQCVLQNENDRFESKHRCKNGRIIDVEVSINLLRDDQKFFVFLRDITERKQTEETIRASESNLTSLINNWEDAIWSIDKNYNIIILNSFFKQEYLRNFNLELKKGTNGLDILSPEMISLWKPNYDRALSGERVVFEFSVQMAEPVQFYEVFLNPIELDDGIAGVSAISMNITERKLAEENLKTNQILLRSIIDGTTDAVYIKDQNGKYIIFNKSASAMVGKSEDEVIGKKDIDIFSLEDGKAVMEADRRIMESGSVNTIEEFATLADGKKHFFLSTKGPLINDDGIVTGLFGIARDITERKQAEENLKDTKAMLQAAFDNSQAGIAIAEAGIGKLIYVNQAALMIRDKSKEQIVDDVAIDKYVSSWNILHFDHTPYKPEDVPLARAVLYGHKVSEEFIVRRDNLEDRIVWANAAPILDDNENVKYGIVVFLDITERKQAEAALIKSKILLSETEKTGKIGGWEFNVETLTQTWTDETFRILEIDTTKGEPKVPEGLDFFAPECRTEVSNAVSRAIEFGEPYDHEWEVITTKGNKRWVHAVAKINKIDDKIISVTGSFQDITERKQAEQHLIETNQSLEELVYIASHDLQVPLVSIEGYATELLEKYADKFDLEGKYCLTRLQSNARRMHTLVLSLLDISRLNTKKYPHEEISLNLLIEKIIQDIALTIEKQEATVNTGKLPALFADKVRIESVFRNLITNSLNYGGKSITLGYENNTFFVKDNGIGIPKSQLERIFNAGERLKKNNAEGVGMGLTFCKKVIEQHKGKIWASSEGENKGTTIFIQLPINP